MKDYSQQMLLMNLTEGDNNQNQHLVMLLGLVISIAMKVEEAVRLCHQRHELLYHQRPKTMHLPCHRHPENVRLLSLVDQHMKNMLTCLASILPPHVEEAKKGNESRKEQVLLLSEPK